MIIGIAGANYSHRYQ